MQENNNFQTIISTWRRLSGEQIESSTLVSMSGDSPDYDLYKKKEEESNLLVPERSKAPLATIASAGVAAAAVDLPPPDCVGTEPEEKQEFLKFEKDENKDGSGDTKEKEDRDEDYLENKDIENKSENKWDKDKFGDNVDSVYLRPPPPHKARSTASSIEEKDCCIECLYYTLQCCDCVLM
ncbi:uncharacterized protein LOC128682917 isoform X2 [Plodia interpunctella]|uniref:uncharacterized protein LOC128682917 isoform X2 n=1 Tax=Plodia interpunctella TaxID=58824 RepID=UPI0023688824|nr:uncharacterized protein LOC128682917 isoform X2 [Plodia interpunctella]